MFKSDCRPLGASEIPQKEYPIFPITRKLLGESAWYRVVGEPHDRLRPETVPQLLAKDTAPSHPAWLPALAQLELADHLASLTSIPPADTLDSLRLNPSLQLITVAWKNLLPVLTVPHPQDLTHIEPGEETILVWCEPGSGRLCREKALPGHLLAIKMVIEGITPEAAAQSGDVTIATIDRLLLDGIRTGILLTPVSRIKRKIDRTAADVFSLQWHLTQTCDLTCKHCYDRSHRADFPFDRALSLLQELRDFCRHRFAQPQISFTGGNPLFHPHFFELYQLAADHGILTAILGNATDRSTLERMLAIQRPVYYQVSLEGLEPHNDAIRGAGNFRRTVAFLSLLTELGIPNLVMLTLTQHNMDQVLPLAKELEGITGALTFNRLALFGEGARLAAPSRDDYQAFLHTYLAALATHPVLALKDSLLNSILEQQGAPLFGGCTGFGCGAAFNFLAILSDGEVHACRKFPSPLGSILEQPLETIYHSDKAARYRDGSSACSDCRLRPVCGGCMAATASAGNDPFTCRDPYCTRPA